MTRRRHASSMTMARQADDRGQNFEFGIRNVEFGKRVWEAVKL